VPPQRGPDRRGRCSGRSGVHREDNREAALGLVIELERVEAEGNLFLEQNTPVSACVCFERPSGAAHTGSMHLGADPLAVLPRRVLQQASRERQEKQLLHLVPRSAGTSGCPRAVEGNPDPREADPEAEGCSGALRLRLLEGELAVGWRGRGAEHAAWQGSSLPESDPPATATTIPAALLTQLGSYSIGR